VYKLGESTPLTPFHKKSPYPRHTRRSTSRKIYSAAPLASKWTPTSGTPRDYSMPMKKTFK